jgi:ribonucleoside-diphosphate reductase alpha chain
MRGLKMKETTQQTTILDESNKIEEIQKIGRDIPKPPENLPEPKLSDNAWYIGRTRYARRDINGQPIESAKELFWRVAYNIATAERIYNNNEKNHLSVAVKFYNLISSRKFMPGTPILLNAGKPNQQLSSCFVLPVPDSLNGIMQTATEMAMIHKSGGGTGFSFSRLRPRNDLLASSGGSTTGPISFMQMYNDITGSIRQGGVRRGANMGILHYNHPDILLFAIYKLDEFSLTNFNISITTSKEFFDQIKIDEKLLGEDYERNFDFDGLVEKAREALQTRDQDLKQVRLDSVVAQLKDWCKEETPGYGYPLINPRNDFEVGRLNAKKVFDLITRFAWQYGDPGMIFMDKVNNSRANPTPLLGQIEATNPCGEQPLLPYDACNLGAVNLSLFVDVKNNDFDWDALRKTVHLSVQFLDNVLDMNDYPIEKVREMVKQIRRIGLGIMGFADALLIMDIGYNTDEGVEMAERVMKFIQQEADTASSELASKRGVFLAYKGSIYDKPGEITPRNGARTTIAPTGTTAMLADASSGCEPLFALTYSKNTIEGKRMFESSPYFIAALKKRGIYSEELLEQIQDNKGSIQSIESIPGDIRKTFVVSSDISPEWHLKVQAAFQKYVDSAISKTINFPNNAGVEDIRSAYLMAHEIGCRGITIYRDGSREKQVLETKKEASYYDKLDGSKTEKNEIIEQVPNELIRLKNRPDVLSGRTHKVNTPLGKAFISINEDDNGNIFEIFINVGRAGSDITADAEAIGRLISLAFRIPSNYTSDQIAQKVIAQLRGIGGSGSTGFGADRVRSLADAIAKVIEHHQATKTTLIVKEESQQVETISLWEAPKSNTLTDMCPECGTASLRFIEGCQKCESCGFSKC